MPFELKDKKSGDVLQSQEWNAILEEIRRLETAKLNREGAENLKGSLTITEALTVNGNVTIGRIQQIAKLEIFGTLKLQQGIAINEFSNDVNLSDNSDLAVPTEKAIKTYTDTRINQVNQTLATKAALAGSATQDFQTKDLRVSGDWYWTPSKNFNLTPTAANQEWSFDLMNQATTTGCYWQVWSDKPNLGSLLVVRGDTGNVGIGTTDPRAKLTVVGTAMISNGSNYAVTNNYMASGSLTIGSVNVSYGGGNLWNSNTAGLLFETQANTEIAVHDAANRLTSFIYYEGDNLNRITIGRDMGWGSLSTLVLNSNNINITGTLTVNSAIRAASSDIYFTDTEHNHTGFGNTTGYAAIENAKNHNALMILGRAGTDKGRCVKLWDYLQVNGNLEVTGSISTGGKIGLRTAHNTYLGVRPDGTAYAGGNFASWEQFTLAMACTRDIKENIANLSDVEALFLLENLNPVKYDYKGEKLFRQNLGFIAEEMPIGLNSENGKTISPFEIIPVLTKVIQSQQKSIIALYKELNSLKAANQSNL